MSKSEFNTGDIKIKATTSIGVYTREEHSLDFEKSLNLADKALYMAKSEGRNKVTLL